MSILSSRTILNKTLLLPLLLTGAAMSVAAQSSGCPGPATGAFTGCYYSNTTLSGSPSMIETDPVIDFSWGAGSPARSLSPLSFSASWQGYFAFNQGTWTFTASASDGVRLYVDGNLVLNQWQDQSRTTWSVAQSMTSGNHLIAVNYFEQTGTASIQVSWQNNSPVTQAPVISSFTATPAVTTPGSAVALAWTVSGATSISIDHDLGEMRSRPDITVWPATTTTYTLTASNGPATSTAAVTVTIAAGGSAPPPTAPALVSATASSPAEVDLVWTASTDSSGVAGYQISRNGAAIASTPGSTIAWADKTVSAASTYTYTIAAYDVAGRYSAPSNALQVTTPPASPGTLTCPSAATNAFSGCYYNNTTLSGSPVFVRNDSQIDFNWGAGSPDRTLTPLGFSARWQGNFTFTGGNYTFSAITSDGLRVYVDGNRILNSWQDQPPTTLTAPYTLTAGSHLLVVEYYEQTGQATAQVSWQISAPAAQPPVISSFTATPSTTTAGQPVTLAWTVSGATSISIDNDLGNMRSRPNLTIWPTQTTTYTLTASGAGGSSTASVTVTITAAGDQQPPTAPALISAIAASSAVVNLTWKASTDNVGVAGYQVLRNGAVLASVSGATLTYSDTTVSANSTYSYSVKAYDAAGNYSIASNTIQVTTPSNASAPSISSFTATPPTIAPGNSAMLAWTLTGATKVTINNAVGDVTSVSSVSVSPAQTTQYILTATNGSGSSTAPLTVTVVSNTDTQPPTTPTLVTAEAALATEVDLLWDASTDNVAVNGYQVFRNGVVVGTTPGTVTVYRDNAVSPNSTYSYAVRAFDMAGNYSGMSNAISVSTPAAPNATVVWYGGCWQPATIYGITGDFQAVDFSLTTSSPVMLQGTLFFAYNCDPGNGTDNMNDVGSTIMSGHGLQGFSHHPDVVPSSAIYWIGGYTPDGMCPAGAPCSGCINYTKTTLSCDYLP